MGSFKIRRFVPPEAYGIAGKFNDEAGNVRAIAGALRGISSNLDANWDGNSQQIFLSEFQNLISQIDSFASWLDSQAGYIRGIEVTERYWDDDD